MSRRSLRINPDVRRTIVYWTLTVSNVAVAIRALQFVTGRAQRPVGGRRGNFVPNPDEILWQIPEGYLVLAVVSLITLAREARRRASEHPEPSTARRRALRVLQFVSALPMLQVVLAPVLVFGFAGVMLGGMLLLALLLLYAKLFFEPGPYRSGTARHGEAPPPTN